MNEKYQEIFRFLLIFTYKKSFQPISLETFHPLFNIAFVYVGTKFLRGAQLASVKIRRQNSK